MQGTKFDNAKPKSYLLAHDVVVSDHNPAYDIQFYAARLREWWNCAGALPTLQLNNADYFGVVKILEFGAQKYAERNWEAGIAYERVFRAAMDHYAKRGGEDDETGLPHRHHFLCCYMFLAAYSARGMHEFDNRPALVARRALDKAWVEKSDNQLAMIDALLRNGKRQTENQERLTEEAWHNGYQQGIRNAQDQLEAKQLPAPGPMDSDGFPPTNGRTS